MEILVIIVLVILFFVFIQSKKSNGTSGPSSSFSRNFLTNFDKDVVSPIRLLKSELSEHDYRENYDRLISEFSIGFIHGFMAYVFFKSSDYLKNQGAAMEKISPFTDVVLPQIFSDKEMADLRQLLREDLIESMLWKEGYEWGWRDAEAWQEAGEVTLTWLDYIRDPHDKKFRITASKDTEEVYANFDDWLDIFTAECERLKPGMGGFIHFMDLEPLERANREGQNPLDIAAGFAPSFDPLTFGR